MKQVATRMERAVRFTRRVLRDFRRNQGLLLSGAIAYYTFLSIVPMTILAVIVLSHVLEVNQLSQVLSVYMDLVIPGYAGTLTEQMQPFLEHRIVLGVVGILALLFFSSIAFSMVENAMTLIFFHRFKKKTKRRHLLVSAIIPYLYLSLIALGTIIVSGAIGTIETFVYRQVTHFGWNLSLEGITGVLLYLAGIVGEFLILSSIYLVMPAVRVSLRYALIGGLTATVLWELTRRMMIWYYQAISMVKLIYGPIAIAVGALLCIEVAAIIILLGAQVIAELQAGSDGDDHAGEVNM
ncbi:MAG: YihY/virulence factor BrkB family protein [Desulfuromonas sp.]|nr:YihY/virulence factor BrkB family protein [Desulfuromonas sp.]